MSFINENEAKFLVALADYLYKQGYNIQDITIMAMYNAQVLYITEVRSTNWLLVVMLNSVVFFLVDEITII